MTLQYLPLVKIRPHVKHCLIGGDIQCAGCNFYRTCLSCLCFLCMACWLCYRMFCVLRISRHSLDVVVQTEMKWFKVFTLGIFVVFRRIVIARAISRVYNASAFFPKCALKMFGWWFVELFSFRSLEKKFMSLYKMRRLNLFWEMRTAWTLLLGSLSAHSLCRPQERNLLLVFLRRR